MQTSVVREVSEETFDEEVVRRSAEVPVVVDFWAPWCGPCRALGPLLERLAEQDGGAWTLAKVNVDESPSLSRQFHVQGIPAVKGFRDGKVVAEFVGAQPERAVRAFLQSLVPSGADLAVAEGQRSYEAGDLAGAEAAFRAALAEQPGHLQAALGLGRLLLDRPEAAAEAEDLLSGVPVATPEGREAAGLLARLRFARQAANLPAAEGDGDADSPAAQWAAGMAAAAAGDYATALEHLAGIVERNRRYRDGAAQQAMRDIFAILGADDPRTVQYQRRMARALFS